MTQGEQFELVGRKRAEYRERKKELATLRAKAAELANTAETVAQGLKFPDVIRWWDGTPFINRRPQHIVLTSAMFDGLTEKNVRQIADDIKRLNVVIASLRQELTALDEDPEPGEVQR
jgi:septal ring factor EnvC (AmiA/AmiB activator)